MSLGINNRPLSRLIKNESDSFSNFSEKFIVENRNDYGYYNRNA